MGQDKFAEGGSIGGYAFDPRTGLYTKPSGEGATTVSPTGGVSRASGEGDGDPFSYINPNVAKETFEEQSARNQELNNLLTNLSTVLSPGATILSGLLSTPFAGAIANAFGGTQDASKADVVNMGTSIPEVAGNFVAEQPGSPDPNNAAPGGFDSDYMAQGGLAALAQGGMSNLGDYSDGGRLLRGPGDGVSDDIPAMIGQKQQARLADGEFVVPARIVSELGNGSTEAGARQLYAMMDRVQKARKKTVGKNKVATNSRAAKLLPA
jgi:hypothetical protein